MLTHVGSCHLPSVTSSSPRKFAPQLPAAACPTHCVHRHIGDALEASCSSRTWHHARPNSRSRSLFVAHQQGDQATSAHANLSHPLVGQRYLMKLDIGRERHTWMPPEWAASGRRVEVPVAVQFLDGGIVEPLGVGAFVQLKVSAGEWHQDKGSLHLWLQTEGLSRGDVTLPPGKLYINVPVWGDVLSKDRGTLTIKQTRWFIRVESRLVGRLRVEKISDEESPELKLGPARMKVGNLEGPLYHS